MRVKGVEEEMIAFDEYLYDPSLNKRKTTFLIWFGHTSTGGCNLVFLGFAEYVCAPENALMLKPASMTSWENSRSQLHPKRYPNLLRYPIAKSTNLF